MEKKESRRWGYFEVLNELNYDLLKIKTKKLVIFPNQNISYQYHNNRSENWYILEGDGEIIIDGNLNNIKAGDVFNIKIQQKHTVKATSQLSIFEVQYGTIEPDESDIVRLETEWDNILKIIKQ